MCQDSGGCGGGTQSAASLDAMPTAVPSFKVRWLAHIGRPQRQNEPQVEHELAVAPSPPARTHSATPDSRGQLPNQARLAGGAVCEMRCLHAAL
jgi:hypothetical protein